MPLDPRQIAGAGRESGVLCGDFGLGLGGGEQSDVAGCVVPAVGDVADVAVGCALGGGGLGRRAREEGGGRGRQDEQSRVGHGVFLLRMGYRDECGNGAEKVGIFGQDRQSSPGMIRCMNPSNRGTVKAVSPCPGLQTIPFETSLGAHRAKGGDRPAEFARDVA